MNDSERSDGGGSVQRIGVRTPRRRCVSVRHEFAVPRSVPWRFWRPRALALSWRSGPRDATGRVMCVSCAMRTESVDCTARVIDKSENANMKSYTSVAPMPKRIRELSQAEQREVVVDLLKTGKASSPKKPQAERAPGPAKKAR